MAGPSAPTAARELGLHADRRRFERLVPCSRSQLVLLRWVVSNGDIRENQGRSTCVCTSANLTCARVGDSRRF